MLELYTFFPEIELSGRKGPQLLWPITQLGWSITCLQYNHILSY